jgi:outer membrane protein TolC
VSLRDLVHSAVANNADVRVAAYDPAVKQAQVVEAQAAFDLKFFTQLQIVSQDNLQPTATLPQLNPFGANLINFKSYEIQTGLRQDLPTGGNVELRYQADQFDRAGPGFPLNAANRAIDPFWTNELALQIKQPLLQNFGTVANTARIAIARNNQKVSLLDFRLALEKNLAELEQAYWQLVQAEQDVSIREQLLKESETTAQKLKDRIGMPGTSNTEVAQANAAVESRLADLVRARAQVEDLSDSIKQHLNDPDLPVSSGVLLLPADVPTENAILFDAEEQIQQALTFRPELSQQQLKISNTEITVDAARNNLLPKLDLVATIGAQGVGQTFNATWQDQWRFDHIDFQAGIQLEVPLGNREARAIYTRTQLQRLQAITQYRGLIDQVTLEVKKAMREVNTSWNEMVRTRQARIAAREALRRFEIDEAANVKEMSPAFINTKLDLQSRLADEARREITAIASYNVAISALERAKGTLLRYDNVILEEDAKPFEDTFVAKPLFPWHFDH